MKNEHSEKLRQIMLSEELSNIEKRDQLRALIPADVCKIDNLNLAIPAQLTQLKTAIAVAEAFPANLDQRPQTINSARTVENFLRYVRT